MWWIVLCLNGKCPLASLHGLSPHPPTPPPPPIPRPGPCNYPANPYSNKRWCCGDHADTQGTHFDLSLWWVLGQGGWEGRVSGSACLGGRREADAPASATCLTLQT